MAHPNCSVVKLVVFIRPWSYIRPFGQNGYNLVVFLGQKSYFGVKSRISVPGSMLYVLFWLFQARDIKIETNETISWKGKGSNRKLEYRGAVY